MTTLFSDDVNVDIVERYRAFIADTSKTGISDVHIVHSITTDPDELLNTFPLFGEFIDNASNQPALVLYPRRFGSMHMANQYAKFSNTPIGEVVGLSGIRAARNLSYETYYHEGAHKVVVANCGHMLGRSHMIDRHNIIVLCNTQEQTLPMSLVKANIHKRISEGERLFVVVFTIGSFGDTIKSNYFNIPNTNIYRHNLITESAQMLTYHHRSDNSVGEVAIELLSTGSLTKGIVICVADQNAANTVERKLKLYLKSNNLTATIATVHNRTNIEDVELIQKPNTSTGLHILINIWALEASSIHANWANVILSDGQRGVFEHLVMSEGTTTVIQEASKLELHLQQTICGWKQPVDYYLCNPVGLADRAQNSLADIDRLPPIATALQTIEAGADPLTLTYDSKQVTKAQIVTSLHRLVNYGLLDNEFKLTSRGIRTQSFQIGVLSKVVLNAAIDLGIVDIALPIVAIMESGGIRHKRMRSHQCDSESDLFDEAAAFAKALKAFNQPVQIRMEIFETLNINMRKMKIAQRVIASLNTFFLTTPNYLPYLGTSVASDNPELRRQLKACLFAAGCETIFRENLLDLTKRKFLLAQSMITYAIGSASVLATLPTKQYTVITGQLRQIELKQSQTMFVIIENVTAYTDEDLIFIADHFPHVLQKQPINKRQNAIGIYYRNTWLTYAPVTAEINKSPIVPTATVTGSIIELVDINSDGTQVTVSQQANNVAVTETIQIAVEEVTVKPKKTKSKPVSPKNNFNTAILASQLADGWGVKLKSRD